jgi:hypothetical protein
MDRVNQYRQLIERTLSDYARIPYSHGELETQTVFDHASDHYLLMVLGREGNRRVHGCVVHIDVKDGKVWIRRDGTDPGIARELMAAGIPPEDIVLAFRLPDSPGEPFPTAASVLAPCQPA